MGRYVEHLLTNIWYYNYFDPKIRETLWTLFYDEYFAWSSERRHNMQLMISYYESTLSLSICFFLFSFSISVSITLHKEIQILFLHHANIWTSVVEKQSWHALFCAETSQASENITIWWEQSTGVMTDHRGMQLI